MDWFFPLRSGYCCGDYIDDDDYDDDNDDVNDDYDNKGDMSILI